MKRLIVTSCATVLLGALPMVALAADTLPTPTPTPGNVASADRAGRLNVLKTHGGAEIDRRLSSLQTAVQRVQDSTKLTNEQSTALTTQIQTEVTGLTALKSKLAAETDLAPARVDVQSIFTEYRVYALMLPKAHLIVAADRVGTAADDLTTALTKLQDKVKTLKSSGKDMTSVQAALDDATAKLADAKPKYINIYPTVIGLTPADYNASHTILATDRTGLAAAIADLKAARTDADTALKAVKAAK